MILTKQHPLYNKIEWVSKAISKDATTRIPLTRLCIERDEESIHIVATCGHRLHRVILHKDNYNLDDIKLQSGLYIYTCSKGQMVLTEETEDIGVYPDYKRVIPETSDRINYQLNYFSGKNWFMSYFKFSTIFDICINPEFYQNAFSIHSEWDVYIEKSKSRLNSPVYAESGECSIVLKPLFLDEKFDEDYKNIIPQLDPILTLEQSKN